MSAQSWLPIALLAQGALGAVDTLFNHELVERLPTRPEARGEIGLHSMREAVYAVLMAGVGCFEWHGAAALVLTALLLLEVLITALDEAVENRIRVLPQNERVLHVLLTLNLGIVIALLAPMLFEWSSYPSALAPVDRGLAGWLLLALGVASAEWSVLDFFAWRELRRAAAVPLFSRPLARYPSPH
ncbi:MAG TPA: hypothetical protein VHL85_11905 [Burkholderiales bacterium]|nr:hypothetical protein [Burkholderiales bacterium]